MRTLINYIRQCFCRHTLEYKEADFTEEYYTGTFNEIKNTHVGTKVSVTCKKCGYHKSYWKY